MTIGSIKKKIAIPYSIITYNYYDMNIIHYVRWRGNAVDTAEA